MKKYVLLLVLLVSQIVISQTDIEQILETGVESANTFSKDYFESSGEFLVNAMTNGWFSTAKTKRPWRFDVGFVGNLSFIREDKRSFILRTQEYDNLTLSNGQTSAQTASALGVNTEEVVVIINAGQQTQTSITLPNGLTNNEIKSFPSGFLQASMGFTNTTDIIVRFLPKMTVQDNAKVQVYGFGLQHEISKWVYRLKRWPVHISALVGYTNIKGFYDANNNTTIAGTDQEVIVSTDSWLITGIASTKFPILNFYGGLGFYFGTSNADLLGTYEIQGGPFAADIVEDPISVQNKTNGMRATFGTSVKFGFFDANLDYSFQNYSNISLGLKARL